MQMIHWFYGAALVSERIGFSLMLSIRIHVPSRFIQDYFLGYSQPSLRDCSVTP
jgi:hypothetical protein